MNGKTPLIVAGALIFAVAGCSERDVRPATAGYFGPGDLETAELAVHTVCGQSAVTVPGIDVSHWQDQIDWDTVSTDPQVQWAYIRIGDGLSTDREFDRNWPEARRVGIPRGAYQYFRPGRDATEQAEHFLAMVGGAGGSFDDDLPPMIDVEDTDGQSAATVRAKMHTWIDIITAATGKQPIIYTGSYFWDDNNLGSDFGSYHVWTAHYTSASCPLVPDAWDDWTIWQYTSSGSVAGISGNVDMNRFDGSLDDLTIWPTCSDTRPISECEVAPPWWCAAVDELYGLGVFPAPCTSYTDHDTFDRGEWAELIGDALTLHQSAEYSRCANPYDDVPSDLERTVGTLAAMDRGDGSGVFDAVAGATLFYPTLEVTRCEAVSMIVEAWGLANADGLSLLYADAAAVPSWCLPYLRAAASASVVQHGAAAFRPNDGATVGESAAMLSNVIGGHGRPLPQASDFNDPSCQGPCTDVCTPGQRECMGAGVLTCVAGADGCGVWGQQVPCPNAQVCGASGVCEPVCVGSECDPGCVGSECDPGCVGDGCEPTCVSECNPGERGCDDGAVAVCVAAGACSVWAFEAECGAGEICIAGACSRCNDPALCDPTSAAPNGRQTSGAEACGCTLSGSAADTSWLALAGLLGVVLRTWRRA